MRHVNVIIILFLISSLSLLSLISQAQSSSLPSDDQSLPPEIGEEDDEAAAADTMDPAAPNSSPFTMPDSDGGDPIILDDPFSSAPGPGPEPEPDIPNVAKTCQVTDNKNLCSESVNTENTFSLLEMEIRATHEATQKALSVALNPKNPDLDTLKHCKDVYVDALSNMQEAMDAIPKKDIGRLKTKLSAAMTDLDTCDEGFDQESKVESSSPMAHFGGKLKKMVSNCLSKAGSIKGETNDHEAGKAQ